MYTYIMCYAPFGYIRYVEYIQLHVYLFGRTAMLSIICDEGDFLSMVYRFSLSSESRFMSDGHFGRTEAGKDYMTLLLGVWPRRSSGCCSGNDFLGTRGRGRVGVIRDCLWYNEIATIL